jgi:PAS domain S-box-containing protein
LVDITERKQAEEALLASESRLRTTLANAPLILTEISKDGIIEFVIGRGLMDAGAEPNTNVGKSVYETNKDTPDRLELFERALKGEEINYTLTQDGLAFNTFVGPRRSAEGEITGVIGVLTNISDLYHAQNDLRERDAVLKLITEKAPLILAQIDKDGKYLHFLGNALSDVGVTADSRLNHTIQEVYPPDHPLRAVYDAAMRGESVETTLDIPDGRVFHVIGLPNRDASGEVCDMVALGVDITGRVEAERKLQRSEAFLTSLLDSAPFILTFIDTDGIIRLSMGSSLTHKGLPVQDLVGKSVYKTYGDNPEHIELFKSALAGNSFRLPIRLGDTTYEVSARPYLDEQGKVTGVLSIALDVSDLKDVEEMLRERESQLTAILENTPMVLAMIGQDGTRKMIVGKLLEELGIDVKPLIGKSIFDDPNQRPEVVEAIRSTLTEGRATSFTSEALGRHFHVFVSPHLDAAGQPIGAVTAALEISDRVTVDRELQEVRAELEQCRRKH